jgi:Kef-type K+ transport system membrane component KefB
MHMTDITAIWGQWLRPSAGLPTVQWSLLLAAAAIVGHLVQRHMALPKVVGYSAVGALAGLAGFSGAAWPLQGIGLFLLELGVSVVLFQTGGRIALRWFRHNPMVLLQSVLEAALTYAAVYATCAGSTSGRRSPTPSPWSRSRPRRRSSARW